MNQQTTLFLRALTIAATSLFTHSTWGANDQSPPQTRSMFLDEISSTNWHHQEDFYGLELGKTYELSCRLRKEPGLLARNAYLAVLTQVAPDGQHKYESHWLVQRLGDKLPADGKWHEVKTNLKVEAPPGHHIRQHRHGELRATMLLYNKSAKGSAISISDLRGVPTHAVYRCLGEKDPSLPQILLIGDSTMMHTYPTTVTAFADVASLSHIPVNSGNSRKLVSNVRRWVGGQKWDLIYFNSGIHDLTRADEKGKRGADNPNAVNLDEYAENLQLAVDYLKTTKAKLLWRSITSLGPKAAGRLQSDEAAYNERAAGIMKADGIPIHDVTNAKRQELMKLSSDGVHFSREGNEILARELRNHIKRTGLIRIR